MKQNKLFLAFSLLGISIFMLFACSKESNETDNNQQVTLNESEKLLEFITKSGDLINTPKAPFTIGADEVFEDQAQSLIIDIRDSSDYFKGHIDGAINVEPKNILSYLDEKVNPITYRNIVIACYSGQSSAYYVTLLRLAGYSNLFTLRYGMAGWSKKLSPNRILDNLSDKYASKLETTVNKAEKQFQLPELKTGAEGGYAILLSRIQTLFEEGFGKAHLKIDSLMQNPENYFIVNYWPEEDYNKGHLPGAFQFTPRQSLSKDNLLNRLPNDKPIAVYCSNGQQSASVAAYLRVLGYNATSVSFGTNGFMYNYMKSRGIMAFNPSEYIADYPMVEGKNPGVQNEKVQSENQSSKEEKAPAIVPIKKKQKTSGGGC